MKVKKAWFRLPSRWHIKLAFNYTIRAFLLIAIISAVYNQRWMVVFVSGLTLVLTWLPAAIERNYNVDLPGELELIMVLFIFTSLFLGEVHGYYTRFWWWDIVLHAGSSLTLGFIGFLILFTLYESKKLDAKPGTIVMFSFCFAVALGALWEIFEYGADAALGLNMQKSGLRDTMWDLILDTAGALIISILGYIYLKTGKTRFLSGILDRFIKNNPHLFEEGK